jgi:hypothetical protein
VSLFMDKFELQKLRDLPIEGVAERLGLQVVRHKSLCPFHNDHHASMSFKVSRNTCRCFVCMTQSIGPIDLVMRHLHMDFKEACKWLADENNIIVSSFFDKRSDFVDYKIQDSGFNSEAKPFDASRYEKFFEHPWLNEEARRFLFDERRIDPRVVRWCRLTSWKDRQGVPWLQIPYFNSEGKLIGVQNRNLNYHHTNPSLPSLSGALGACDALLAKNGPGERPPRFRFPSGSQCGIYNLPVLNLLKPGDELWITEGCSDCWAMLSSGRKAIAIPSATLLSKKDAEQLQAIAGFKFQDSSYIYPPPNWGDKRGAVSFHMFPDRDVPGERLFLQLREVLPSLERHQLPQGCKDYSDYYLTTIRKEADNG